MKIFLLLGVALAILGIVGLARPFYSTTQSKDIAHMGDLHLKANETTEHEIPPLASGGVLALGVVLIGASLMRRG